MTVSGQKAGVSRSERAANVHHREIVTISNAPFARCARTEQWDWMADQWIEPLKRACVTDGARRGSATKTAAGTGTANPVGPLRWKPAQVKQVP